MNSGFFGFFGVQFRESVENILHLKNNILCIVCTGTCIDPKASLFTSILRSFGKQFLS